MWTIEQLLAETQKQVKPSRFNHILGVVNTAKSLAKEVGIDVDQAEIAAILHDFCKEWSKEKLQNILIEHHDTDWLSYSAVTWHAPVAAYIAGQQFGIHDCDVFNAIYFHTTGRAHMSLLEKVIWVADYIEPNRDFTGVEVARDLAKVSLDEALCYGLHSTIQYLMSKQQSIHPYTFEAYNYYVNRRVLSEN